LVTIHHEIKKEMVYLSIVLLLEIVLFKSIFNKESFSIIIKLSLSLFWLFIFPGFMIMYLFFEKLDFLSRLIAGVVLGMAFYGAIGYNLGVLGLPIKYQIWLVPALGVMTGIISLIKKKQISVKE